MSVLDLMTRLRSAGVRLTAVDGKLRVQAAKGTLTPELQSELAAHKAEIIALLTPDTALPPLRRADRAQPLPLSFAQQRLWFLDELEPGTAIYNMPFALRIRGPLDTGALQAALDDVVMRHEALRTVFPTRDEQPVQQVLPELAIPLELRRTDGAAAAAAIASESARTGFDLATGPLLRAQLLEAATDDYLFVLVMHHIISDLWSTDVLLRDLSHSYASHTGAPVKPLPELAFQYADYAVWQRELLDAARRERLSAFWHGALADAPARLDLPTDFARPPEPSYAGNWLARRLESRTVAALDTLLTSSGCTLFMVNLAIFALLLGRYARTDDVVIGTPISGRLDHALEALVGFFLNTLALRLHPTTELTVERYLQQVRDAAVQAFEHQALPFEQLVEELQPERDMSHTPVFQHMFICQDDAGQALTLPGLAVDAAELISHGTAKFDLTLVVKRSGDRVELGVEYSTELFREATIGRLLDHYVTLLEAAAADPQQPLHKLSLLTESEHRRVTAEFNATATDFAPQTVHRMVEAQVERTPDAPAVLMGADTVLSYRELNGRANALAEQLIAAGAGPGERIVLACERSPELAIAALAIVKAGACYVPVDPAYPPERIHAMCRDAAALLCLTRDGTQLGDTALQTLAAAGDIGLSANLRDTARPEDPLYCIYTSGSTGTPKGVQLSHAGLANLLQWQQAEPRLGRPARTLQFASFSFDVSFQECFGAWTTGGSVVMVTAEERQDLAGLAGLICQHDIDRLYLPCAALQPLAESFLAGRLPTALQDVVVAGEALQISPELRELFAALPAARLHNHYGPSETHVVTALTLAADPRAWDTLPSIGRPIANTQCLVLDDQQRPVPVGVAGELYLGGIQVGIGYWQRATLTAEKFQPSPLDPDCRLYRTGDAARWLDTGELEFLGRCDDQVKWRGYRVEPGEIEAALTDLPAVSQAVVVLREDAPGVPQLVGYVTPASGHTISVADLREGLRQRLPDFMLPSRLIELDALPLTPSGKVARRQLPAPPTEAADSGARRAPRSDDEQALAEIWASVLGLTTLSMDDDFFACGGHSLLATKVITRISERFGIRLPLKYLFRYPTPAGLMAAIDTLRQARQSAPQAPAEDREEFRI